MVASGIHARSGHERGECLGLALGGGAAFACWQADAPYARTLPPPIDPTPRIVLARGSRGPRGCVHTGVLRVLDEACIVPGLVTGSSIGALIGAFWAGGLSAAEIDRRGRRFPA